EVDHVHELHGPDEEDDGFLAPLSSHAGDALTHPRTTIKRERRRHAFPPRDERHRSRADRTPLRPRTTARAVRLPPRRRAIARAPQAHESGDPEPHPLKGPRP